MMNDTQLVEAVIDFLDLQDRVALEYFLEHGDIGWDGIEHTGMTRGDQGYRPTTDEEKEERRRKAQAHRERMERGEGTPMERLLWTTMGAYTQKMSDAIFTAKPLVFHITEEDE